MIYRLLADLVVLLHFGFVVFVLGGGILAWRWPRLVWLHVPAAGWGIAIEWSGGICPLTPLENWLRSQAGGDVYAEDFIARYVLPMLYPTGLTRSTQMVLGFIALAVNVVIYAGLAMTRRRATRTGRAA